MKPYPAAQQASLNSPCPDAPEFKGKDMGDLLEYTVDLVYIYHECKAKHAALVGAKKKPR